MGGHVYIPTNWINKKTQLNAANMNKIEEELARLSKEAGGITEVLEGPGIDVTTIDRTVIVGLRSGSAADNLLVLDKDEGLILTLSLAYDPETRKLVLSSGSGWSTEVNFDVDRAVVDGNYDPETKNIVLTLSDDSEIIIDMSKFKLNWKMIDSKSIEVVESEDEDGIPIYTFNCKISEEEGNNLTIKDDGLYSERLDWNNLGISDETDGRWEFDGEVGNKYWYFQAGKAISIDHYKHVTKWRELDYYNFGYKISTAEGNILEIRDGKLFSPDEIPADTRIRLELERLTDEYRALYNIKFGTTKSIKINRKEDPDTGEIFGSSDVRLSTYLGNEIEIRENGIYVPPYKPDPDMPDLGPYLARLVELEKEYPRAKSEVEYINNSANI